MKQTYVGFVRVVLSRNENKLIAAMRWTYRVIISLIYLSLGYKYLRFSEISQDSNFK